MYTLFWKYAMWMINFVIASQSDMIFHAIIVSFVSYFLGNLIMIIKIPNTIAYFTFKMIAQELKIYITAHFQRCTNHWDEISNNEKKKFKQKLVSYQFNKQYTNKRKKNIHLMIKKKTVKKRNSHQMHYTINYEFHRRQKYTQYNGLYYYYSLREQQQQKTTTLNTFIQQKN